MLAWWRRLDSWLQAVLTVRRMVLATAAVTLVWSLLAALFPVGGGWDAMHGLRVWAAMRSGAPFNSYFELGPQLAHLHEKFEAAWSPGQYLFPGALAALGLPIGGAVYLVIAISIPLGLWGYWRLYRRFGFSEGIAALAVLGIALARPVSFMYSFYLGGEVLFFAGFPWFLEWAFRLRERRFWGPLLFPLLFVAGCLLLKLSVAIAGLAAAAAIVLGVGATAPDVRGAWFRATASRALIWGLAFAAGYACLHWLYTSRGWTAAEMMQGSADPFKNLLLIVGSAPVAWFSGYDLIDAVFFRRGGLRHEFLRNPELYWTFGLLAILSLSAMAWLVWQNRKNDYGRLLAAFLVVYVPVLLYLFSFGGSWYEERHLRPLSYLLLPGFLQTLAAARPAGRRLAFALLFLAAFGYSAGASANHARTRAQYAVSERTWLNQWHVDQSTLRVLHGLRQGLAGATALFASPNVALAVEVEPQRFVLIPEIRSLQPGAHRGSLPHLVIHLPARPLGPAGVKEISAVRSAFPEIQDWFAVRTSDAVILHGGTASPPALPGVPKWAPVAEPETGQAAEMPNGSSFSAPRHGRLGTPGG